VHWSPLFRFAPSPRLSSFRTTLMCDALAAVWCSAWAASFAPRYSPGVQPAARRIFWPKVLVLRAQLLLLGSVCISCLLYFCQQLGTLDSGESRRTFSALRGPS
jgi:hypothetical protein